MTIPDNPPPAHLIPLLASAMLVVQMLMVVQRMLLTNIRLFAVQSLLLATIAFVVGIYSGSVHLFVVGTLTLALKVFFLPWFLMRIVRRIGEGGHDLFHRQLQLSSADKLRMIVRCTTHRWPGLGHGAGR